MDYAPQMEETFSFCLFHDRRPQERKIGGFSTDPTANRGKLYFGQLLKKTPKEFQDMPLIAGHDSFLTTEPFGDLLLEMFHNQAKLYFGTTLQLKNELW